MATTTADCVHTFVKEQLRPKCRISPDAILGELAESPEDLGWCVRKIELKLGIKISDEEEKSLETLEDLIDCVREKVEEKRIEQANRPSRNPVAA